MDYITIAMNCADSLGVDYADIRLQKTRTESIYLRNTSLKDTSDSILYGYGIRVLHNGAWGFAHNNIFTKDAIEKTVKTALNIAKNSAKVKTTGIKLAPEHSYKDSYKTPMQIDPFSIPLNEKVEFMMEVNKTMLNYKGIKLAFFHLLCRNDNKIFANTEGTRLHMDTTYVSPTVTAHAVTDEDSQSRTFTEGGVAKGWEYIQSLNLLGKAEQIAEEALMKVKADVLKEEKRRTLVLDPEHLGLTMHESVGHPTESDRVLGWEADFAGLTFVKPEMRGNYQYGSEIVNFVADNTLKTGLATAGWDDDGVPGQKFYIIKNGILNELGTTRETAPLVNETLSRSCNRATNYYDTPINRIPNLYLEPGKERLTPQELISDTEEGIYISGRGSFSIDQHRVNFQFGGDMFWEIKNGKKVRPLKKVLYKSNNPEFWNSCDAICDERFFKTFGIVNCGKGQPMQAARMTHGASLARFRNIRTGGSQ